MMQFVKSLDLHPGQWCVPFRYSTRILKTSMRIKFLLCVFFLRLQRPMCCNKKTKDVKTSRLLVNKYTLVLLVLLNYIKLMCLKNRNCFARIYTLVTLCAKRQSAFQVNSICDFLCVQLNYNCIRSICGIERNEKCFDFFFSSSSF